MAIDPEGARYPGTRDPEWARGYRHRLWRRWERRVSSERPAVWLRFKQRLRTLFNPRWLP